MTAILREKEHFCGVKNLVQRVKNPASPCRMRRAQKSWYGRVSKGEQACAIDLR